MVSDGKVSLEDGSSPLTRGKPAPKVSVATTTRLIPAHAGKTQLSSQFFYRKEAHPRSRGENRCDHLVNPVDAWLIPAHAGKTETRTT